MDAQLVIGTFQMYLHRNKWKQRFCGGHLGLQDYHQEYKFENVPIGFANL